MQTPEALPCRSCSGQHRLQKLGSGGERKDLGPTAEEWECTVQWFGKKKKKIIVNIYRPVSCKCIAQFRHSAGLFLEPAIKQAVCLNLSLNFFLEVGGRKYSRSSKNAFKQQKAEEVERADSHPHGLAGPTLPGRRLRPQPSNRPVFCYKDSTGVLGPYHGENSHKHKIHLHFHRLLQVCLGQYVCVQLAVRGNVQVLNNIVVGAEVPRSSPC